MTAAPERARVGAEELERELVRAGVQIDPNGIQAALERLQQP